MVGTTVFSFCNPSLGPTCQGSGHNKSDTVNVECTSTILTEEGRSLETILTFNVIIYNYSNSKKNDIPTWQSGLRLLDLRDLQWNISEHVTDVPLDQDVATSCPHGTRPRHGGGPWPATELLAVTRRIKWRNSMHNIVHM